MLWTMEAIIEGFLQVPGVFRQTTFAWEGSGVATLGLVLGSMLILRSLGNRRGGVRGFGFLIPPGIVLLAVCFG